MCVLRKTLDAMIVLGMIFLTEAGQQSDQRKGRMMAIVGLVLVSIFFSLILSVFRSKAQGYPYRYHICSRPYLRLAFTFICFFNAFIVTNRSPFFFSVAFYLNKRAAAAFL